MGRSLTVTVPGTLDGLAQAAGAADAFCREATVPEATRRNLLTVIDEVLANVVHHGLSGASGSIELTMGFNDKDVRVNVADPAPPFNPLLAPVPDTSAPLERRKVGGLGIALVRALTDELAYERRDGHNHLTLIWHLESEGS